VVHGAMGAGKGSREQQHTQPRQTDSVSSLFEMGVVRREWHGVNVGLGW
jgi:hypothetical protein